MKLLQEESYVVDYLCSLALINEKEEIEKDESLLDKVIDTEYKAKEKEYVDELEKNLNVTKAFIGQSYNLVFRIATYYNEFKFKKFITRVEKLEVDELKLILQKDLSLKENFTLSDIEELGISFKDKWNLAKILAEFDLLKGELVKELKENYKIYQKTVKYIEKNYSDKIKETLEIIKNKDELYARIFKKYLSKEVFDEFENIYILLVKVNFVEVNKTSNSNFIALGNYVLDYFEKLEEQKKLDEVKVNQVLKSLADPTRYGIIKAINQGITSNSVLAEMFSISRAAISMQFKTLQENDIIYLDATTKQHKVNKEIINHALENLKIELDL